MHASLPHLLLGLLAVAVGGRAVPENGNGDINFGRGAKGQRLLGAADLTQTSADGHKFGTYEKYRRVRTPSRIITQISITPYGDQLPIAWVRAGGAGHDFAELGFLVEKDSGIVYEIKVYGVDASSPPAAQADDDGERPQHAGPA